jgi:hypothetical protein
MSGLAPEIILNRLSHPTTKVSLSLLDVLTFFSKPALHLGERPSLKTDL